MARFLFGIYGFDFCKRSQVRELELIPLHAYPDSHVRGQDKKQFLLTGYGLLPPETVERDSASYTETIRRLADGMTFCQQQHVILTPVIRVSDGDTSDAMIKSERLPQRLLALHDRHTGGAIIANDALFPKSPKSRVDFLELFLNHIARENGSNHLTEINPLTAALYRQIEIWRLSVPYLELEHFLAFSGLEILGRAYGPHSCNGNAAVPISGLLRQYGFDVPQTLAEDWCLARNGAFHRGQRRSGKDNKMLDVADQVYALTTLLADLSLKILKFDDGHINWSRWQDRQPFK